MIKIYFNAKPLYLCNEITPQIDELLHRPDTMFIDELNQHSVNTMIYEMQQDTVYNGVFLHHDLDALLNTFKNTLTLVQAAGGFVQSGDHVLIIFRRGKWDLPKGKLDEGEDLETCAVREVQEETGIQKVKLSKPLTITYHTYHERDQLILKESHWYQMRSSKKVFLAPQHEEGIEQCIWAKLADLPQYMANTHRSIQDVVEIALKELK